MQKRIWGLTASMLALTCLTVTGCGTTSNAKSQVSSPSTITVGTTQTNPSGSKEQNQKSSSTADPEDKTGNQNITSTNSSPLPSNHSFNFGGYTIYSKKSLGPIISGLYTVQGIIIHVNQKHHFLDSIVMKITKPITTANGTPPFNANQVVTIHFDQSLSQAGSLQITSGDQVQLTFGQFIRESDHKTLYGSNFSWLAIEKNGAFYNSKGKTI
ncbi:hypothetical protein [Alicyclobacillus tolerans]|uniref:Uncharacterized protein n=1 Tax=Alicyclobacillus tolerans TaxID=90970 RepID=A0A1M6WIH3_9BACL|nr:hypothetical protein [Alicyclobacillus montanus]SHK93491.1 hypothetical protein SAMN05443507_1282 [Alicyclobacillus montanus]